MHVCLRNEFLIKTFIIIIIIIITHAGITNPPRKREIRRACALILPLCRPLPIRPSSSCEMIISHDKSLYENIYDYSKELNNTSNSQ